MASGNECRLDRMTWPDVHRALEDQADVVMLPIGAFEQHGPHMGLITDSALVTAIAERAARQVPGVLVAPTIVYGISHHHMDFPGTATLRPDTLKNVIKEVGTSLVRHGFKALVLLNGHGGNNGTVSVAAVELRSETGRIVADVFAPHLAKDACKALGMPVGGHADEVETSMMMALAPDLVQMHLAVREYAKDMPPFDFAGKSSVSSVASLGLPRTKDFTESGTLGDATMATKEAGEQLLATSVDTLVRFLAEFRRGLRQGAETE